MKKVLLSFSLMLSVVVSGQDIPDLILGGTLNFSYSQSDDVEEFLVPVDNPVIIFPGAPTFVTRTQQVKRTRSSYHFFPYVGRVVSPNTTIGVGLNIGISRLAIESGNNSTSQSSSTQFGGYLWMRYTLNPAQQLRLYVEPQLGFDSEKGSNGMLINNGNNFVPAGIVQEAWLNVPIGMTYSISPRLLANFRLGGLRLVSGKYTSEDEDESSSYFNTGIDVSSQTIRFGVEFFL